MSMYLVRVFDKDTSNYLGIVFIHDDGYIMSLTDWGDFNFHFSAPGGNILKFLTSINEDYLTKKVANSWVNNNAPKLDDKGYLAIEGKAYMYADKILPSLQAAIMKGKYQVYEHTSNGEPQPQEE